MTIHRKILGAATVLAALALVATPAAADPPVTCITSASLPIGDGNYIYSKSTLTCPTGYGLIAASVTSRVQEKVSLVWTTRATGTAGGSTITVSKTTSYYCNGHGTDSWRTSGTGTDNYSRTSSSTSNAVSLTC